MQIFTGGGWKLTEFHRTAGRPGLGEAVVQAAHGLQPALGAARGPPALNQYKNSRLTAAVFAMACAYFSWKEAHSVPVQLGGELSQQPTWMLFREQKFWGAW